MFETLEIFRMAQGMATHAAARHRVVAENIANADTPGYKARDVQPFAEQVQGGSGFKLRQTRPGHSAPATSGHTYRSSEQRDAAQSPNGNSVSIEREMVRAVETTRQHDLAVNVYRNALGILRTSIGR
ncbi:FlgB family protein [Actibacterium ureilyticum]|uniref:FlgB family protein n=1 Tax=Actibacterium ureilyticum TaxID=1590614 RepID=UPI000BAAD88E|nr:FlgB family protein [Actibacterium ureilyticum]